MGIRTHHHCLCHEESELGRHRILHLYRRAGEDLSPDLHYRMPDAARPDPDEAGDPVLTPESCRGE